MTKNLNRFERGARIAFGITLLLLSFIVFSHPVARLLVILAGLWVSLEGATGCCPLYAGLGMKKAGAPRAETVLMLMIAGVQASIGYVWLNAGWDKIWNGNFIASLPQTLADYAYGNPFWFMRNFMLNQASEYYRLFGGLIQVTQYFIGIGLIALAYALLVVRKPTSRNAVYYLSAVAFAAGALMNAAFYFALGHSDPWASAGNVAMFWIQAVLLYGNINLLKAR
jgi:hypothetical protein